LGEAGREHVPVPVGVDLVSERLGPVADDLLEGLLEPGRAGRLQELPEELVRRMFHSENLSKHLTTKAPSSHEGSQREHTLKCLLCGPLCALRAFVVNCFKCRKCLTPVKTIAKPCSSQAAMLSASRWEPPGWAIAVTPAAAAASTLSRKGKNASDASTLPFTRSPAFFTAICTESTRDICPAPTPTTCVPRASTIAFDFTCLQTIQANFRAASSSAVGTRFVFASHLVKSSAPTSRVCTKSPPSTRR